MSVGYILDGMIVSDVACAVDDARKLKQKDDVIRCAGNQWAAPDWASVRRVNITLLGQSGHESFRQSDRREQSAHKYIVAK